MDEKESVAVARRLRELLVRERDKLREYLAVLEKEEQAIEKEDAAAIKAHTVLGENIVQSIAAIQKVATPLYKMLPPEKRIAVTQITELQGKVTAQNRRNCELLRTHIDRVQGDLHTIQNHPYRRRGTYASSPTMGTLVEIEA